MAPRESFGEDKPSFNLRGSGPGSPTGLLGALHRVTSDNDLTANPLIPGRGRPTGSSRVALQVDAPLLPDKLRHHPEARPAVGPLNRRRPLRHFGAEVSRVRGDPD